MNTLERTTEIIPLPVLNAEALLTDASESEHKDDFSMKQNREEILKFTAAAKPQLQLAESLGYGNKDDYDSLYASIDEIR
ncbi:MAG: hypothetical protein ACU837_11565 [Gammaproteobacteria bacterium]